MALVGREDAVLRDDQWRAIEALVPDRRRALVVQRTGWGKSAVYFVATALLRGAGARARRYHLPAAGAHAQPDRGCRAGRDPRAARSTPRTRRVGEHAARVQAGEIDVLLVSPSG